MSIDVIVYIAVGAIIVILAMIVGIIMYCRGLIIYVFDDKFKAIRLFKRGGVVKNFEKLNNHIWYLDKECTNQFIVLAMPKKSLVLYAKKRKKRYF